jgi:hypothetical protein
MGTRPPQQDRPERGGTEFGIVALDRHLEEASLTYPTPSDELVRALGDPEIPIDPHGHALSLSTAVDRAGSDTFDSEQAVLNDLHPVFEAERAETSFGVLGSLRAMLPF